VLLYVILSKGNVRAADRLLVVSIDAALVVVVSEVLREDGP
jgi:hypothetical protein